MNIIFQYLKETYEPLAIVEYGSFVAGTNDEYSDYDCLVIVNNKSKRHDDSIIDGVQLDCFIFTQEEVRSEDLDAFLTVYDGNILMDTNGIAAELKERVREYVREHEKIDEEEKDIIVSWIRKTLHRAQKNDDEGNYRLLAFLWESLTEYFLLRDMFYFGSKNAVQYLKEHDKEGYMLYHNAVTDRTNAAIVQWAEHVIRL